MAQTLKEETRVAIVEAALAVFAEKGYRDASMQEVSRRAGLSAGNIYRYYPDKKSLYDAALPPQLLDELSGALDRKISGWQGNPFLASPDPAGSETRFRQELLELLANNRLEWIVILRNGAADALTERLVAFYERWRASLRPAPALDETRRVTVRVMYRNLVGLIASVLAENGEPEALRAALGNCIDYHMAGLAAVMDKWRKE